MPKNWAWFFFLGNFQKNFMKSRNFRGGGELCIYGMEYKRFKVYLINPNGVIFGAGSSVNVGNLYASTRNIDEAAVNEFKTNWTNP